MPVVFQDPPKQGGRKREDFVSQLEEVMDKPNTWGIIALYPRGVHAHYRATRLRKGEYPLPTHPPGTWDFKGATTPDGKGELYARFNS